MWSRIIKDSQVLAQNSEDITLPTKVASALIENGIQLISPSNELPNHSKNTISFLSSFNCLSRISSWKEKLEKRTEHANWCDDLLWLHDDSKKGAAIYYICMSYNKLKKWNKFSNNMDPAFVEKGFRNWKKCQEAHKPQNIQVPSWLCQVIKWWGNC